MLDFNEIANAILELPENQRVEIAALALGSLPMAKAEEDAIEAAWETEIQHRIAAIDAGLEVGTPWQDVKSQTRLKYLQ